MSVRIVPHAAAVDGEVERVAQAERPDLGQEPGVADEGLSCGTL